MMRYELSDGEWSILRVMLPNKPRGVAVWMADAFSAVSFGCCAQAPRGTISRKPMAHVCYDRFVRWQRAGIWRNITMALATLPDARMEMIDTSMVRVHQHAACVFRQRKPIGWALKGRTDQQTACGRRCKRIADPPWANARRGA